MSEASPEEKDQSRAGGDPPHLRRDLLAAVWVVVLGGAALWLLFRFVEQNRVMECMARSNRGCLELEQR